MALNFDEVGDPIALIDGGKKNGEILYVDRNEEIDGFDQLNVRSANMIPLINPNSRDVAYIAGPSGSGKSTYTAKLIKSFSKIFPERDIFMLCRTNIEEDPAYEGLGIKQIRLDETLLEDPIDIETDIPRGSMVCFDDTSTVNNKKIKTAIIDLMMDLMECGRKRCLYIVVTNHLVNPSEKALGRTIMNEMKSFTFFHRSGSFHQIKYCLKTYFGMSNKDIDLLVKFPGRWITVFKNYPMVIMYQHGAYQM